MEAPPPLAAAVMYSLTIAGESISGLLRTRATANPFTRGFLLFLEQQGAHEYYSLTKKSGAYPTSFNHQRSTKSLSQTQKCM